MGKGPVPGGFYTTASTAQHPDLISGVTKQHMVGSRMASPDQITPPLMQLEVQPSKGHQPEAVPMSPLSPRPAASPYGHPGRSPSPRTEGWGTAEPNQAAFPGKADLANKATDKSRQRHGWVERTGEKAT